MKQSPEEKRRDIELIATLANFEHGQALLRATQAEVDEVREEIEINPVIGCEDVKRDIKYRLGFIAGLNRTISRPTEAQNLLDHLSKGGAR